jgi:L-threonine kinase
MAYLLAERRGTEAVEPHPRRVRSEPEPAVRNAPDSAAEVAIAVAPATCGELVQGVIDERDFLITSPIDWFARVTVELHASGGIEVSPAGDFSKVVRAVRSILERLGRGGGGARVRLESTVPRGKGLASSSADITAAIHACFEAAGSPAPPYLVSELAVAVEPTDGVFFSGSAMYDQVQGRLIELLGAPPPLAFVVVDSGGHVDTVGFDRERSRANARRHAAELARAVRLVRWGFRDRHPGLVAQGATISARCNQHVLLKPELETLVEGTVEAGALGVNCAHSGTVLGVMFDPTRTDGERLHRRVAELVGEERILGTYRLVSGGSRLARTTPMNLTAAQRPFLEVFGGFHRRVRVGSRCALEFEAGGGQAQRFFAYPDGTLQLEHPSPSEEQWSTPVLTPPRAGELWVMQVELLRGEPDTVWYRPLTSSGLCHVTRSLPRELFEQAFRSEGATWARYVRVVEVERGELLVSTQGEGPPLLRRLPVPIFLSIFRRYPMETHDTEPAQRLATYTREQGIDARLIHPGADMPTVPLAAAALGVAPGQIVKSIVFEGKKGPGVALAIVPGDVKVDRAKVAAVLGLPTLKLAKPEVVLRSTGYEVGGVPPVGHAERLPTVVDSRVLQHATVYGGGGDERHMLSITPADIVRLTGAKVADVANTDESQEEKS